MKHKAYFINNNILASRYVANMKTFGFVPYERGRHQFHLKLIRFWLYIYSLNTLNRLNLRIYCGEKGTLTVFIMLVNILLLPAF